MEKDLIKRKKYPNHIIRTYNSHLMASSESRLASLYAAVLTKAWARANRYWQLGPSLSKALVYNEIATLK
jgi:hypothetical protein